LDLYSAMAQQTSRAQQEEHLDLYSAMAQQTSRAQQEEPPEFARPSPPDMDMSKFDLGPTEMTTPASSLMSPNRGGGSVGNLLDDESDDELELMARREMIEEEEGLDNFPAQPMAPQPMAPHPRPQRQAAPPAPLPPKSHAPPERIWKADPQRPPSGRQNSSRGSLASSKGDSPPPQASQQAYQYLIQTSDHHADEVSSRGVSASRASHGRYQAVGEVMAAQVQRQRHERRDMLVDCIINDSTPRKRAATPRSKTPSRGGSRTPSRGPPIPTRNSGIGSYEDAPLKKPATPRSQLADANKAGLRHLAFFEAQPVSPGLPQLTPRSAGPGGKLPMKQRSQKSLAHPSGSQSARAWRSKASANLF